MALKLHSGFAACAFSLIAGVAAASEARVAPVVTSLENPAPKTALYVGNSFTYYNCGVNGYVRGLAKEAKLDFKGRMITISAGRLSYHDVEQYLSRHDADPYFKDGKKPFDVVFLQAQSAEPIAEKYSANYRKYLAKHIETVRKAGAEPIVVATWARQNEPQNYARLMNAVTEAANASKAMVLPVGLAFEESLRVRPDLILHHTDKLHPSAAGSYLYGALMYIAMFKKSPEGLKFPGDCAKPLADADRDHLQSVAWKVAKQFYGW